LVRLASLSAFILKACCACFATRWVENQPELRSQHDHHARTHRDRRDCPRLHHAHPRRCSMIRLSPPSRSSRGHRHKVAARSISRCRGCAATCAATRAATRSACADRLRCSRARHRRTAVLSHRLTRLSWPRLLFHRRQIQMKNRKSLTSHLPFSP